MNNTSSVVVWAIIALLIGGAIGYYAGHVSGEKESSDASVTSEKARDFDTAMRKLWEDHITFTRLAIVDLANGSPSTETTLNKLLENPNDFTAALTPYYGSAAAGQFGALLKDHLTIAAELVQAAKAGDQAKAKDAETRWYANGDAMATFLAKANPNWSEGDLKNMFREHLDLVKEEAVEYLEKDYVASIEAYDKNHDQALMMADMLASGIEKQFPEKF
jgi:hypothetical protein